MSEIKEQIVERLRNGVCVAPSLTGDGFHIDIPATHAKLTEAADRIVMLEKALESAVSILRGEIGSGWAERNEADWLIIDAALNATPQDGKGGEEW